MILLLVLLLALGGACAFFAPLVQRTALRMMGRPRNRLAEWSSKLASSRTGRLGIRASGALRIAAAVVLWLASSRSSARAEATLDELASGVVWRSVLELHLDGDGRVESVLLGKTPSEAVLGVVPITGGSCPSSVSSSSASCSSPAPVGSDVVGAPR